MKISLKEWQLIAADVKSANDAIDKLESTLVNIWYKYSVAGDKPETDLLQSMISPLNDIHLPDVRPHQEWTGGDSENARNFRWREPHCAGKCSSRRYFTDIEVSEYEDTDSRGG